MATSFVEYHEKGFWCDGSYLKLWLYFFIKEADSEHKLSQKLFLDAVLSEWQFQATINASSALDLRLDALLSDQRDKELLLQIERRLYQKMLGYGAHIPTFLLTSANRDIQGINWPEPPLTTSIAKVGVLFRRLLQGELTTDAASPLHYLEFKRWNTLELF